MKEIYISAKPKEGRRSSHYELIWEILVQYFKGTYDLAAHHQWHAQDRLGDESSFFVYALVKAAVIDYIVDDHTLVVFYNPRSYARLYLESRLYQGVACLPFGSLEEEISAGLIH
jgi:hypothetical protein